MMNLKSKILVVVLLFNFSLINSQNSRSPNEIGKEVFSILKKIDKQSDLEYINNFEKIDVIRDDVREDNSLSENNKGFFYEISKDVWEAKILKDRFSIIESAKEFNIIWENIIYSDFIYAKKSYMDMPQYECVIIFDSPNNKNLIYGVNMLLFSINDKFYIYEIRKLVHKIKGEPK